jgi:hypothetical protein
MIVGLTACASSSKSGFEADAGAPGPAPVGPVGPVDSGVQAPAPSFRDDAGGSVPQGDVEVFANSDHTLYRIDPTTYGISVVGDFAGCNVGIQDIALDAQSNMYATTGSTLWRVDRKTATCLGLVVADPNLPVAISFVPKGTVDPNEEALVGFTWSDYVRVDLNTKSITKLGTLGKGYTLSGDFASVIGGSTYVSVKGNGCNDCLVEIDVKTGAITKEWGSLKHSQVSGLAFWAGKVYGFEVPGYTFEVTLGNMPLSTKDIDFNPRPNISLFNGAGSTTSAPLGPK